MIGILIPVHNEEQLLDLCLETIKQAAAHPDLKGECVEVLVVLDSCTDRSAEIARAHGVMILEVSARNVGRLEHRARSFFSTGVHAGWRVPMATAPWPVTGLPNSWRWMPTRCAERSRPATGARTSRRPRKLLTCSITSTVTVTDTFMVPIWASARLRTSAQVVFRHCPATKTCT